MSKLSPLTINSRVDNLGGSSMRAWKELNSPTKDQR